MIETALNDETILVAASSILRARGEVKAWMSLGDVLASPAGELPSDVRIRATVACLHAADAIDLAIRELAAEEAEGAMADERR